MIIKNKIVKRIVLSIKFLILLGILLNSVEILYVRFMGNKINIIVENVHRNGFRSSYSIGEFSHKGEIRNIYYCPNSMKNGTEIEVYRSDLLNTMLYAGISKGTIFFQFMVLIISIVAILSLFIKDDES